MNQTNKGKAKVFSEWLCAAMLLILTFYNTNAGITKKFHRNNTSAIVSSGSLMSPSPSVDTIPGRLSTQTITDTVPRSLKDTSLVVKGDTSTVLTADTFNFKINSETLPYFIRCQRLGLRFYKMRKYLAMSFLVIPFMSKTRFCVFLF